MHDEVAQELFRYTSREPHCRNGAVDVCYPSHRRSYTPCLCLHAATTDTNVPSMRSDNQLQITCPWETRSSRRGRPSTAAREPHANNPTPSDGADPIKRANGNIIRACSPRAARPTSPSPRAARLLSRRRRDARRRNRCRFLPSRAPSPRVPSRTRPTGSGSGPFRAGSRRTGPDARDSAAALLFFSSAASHAGA